VIKDQIGKKSKRWETREAFTRVPALPGRDNSPWVGKARHSVRAVLPNAQSSKKNPA